LVFHDDWQRQMTVITSRECDHHARPLMSWPFGNEDDFFLACSCCPHAYNVPSGENLGQSGSKCENYCCVDELLKPTHLSGLFHNSQCMIPSVSMVTHIVPHTREKCIKLHLNVFN
jgi:hypothetical protein